MNRIVLLLAITGVLFTSCERMDSDYLAGTTWTESWESGEHKIMFTDTHYTYTYTSSEGVINGSSMGTYTYDAPAVTLTVDSDDYLDGMVNAGKVKKRVMDIDMFMSLDLVLELKLQKQ